MRIRLIGSRSRIARKLLRFYHWNTRLGCVLTKATCVQFPCRFAARLTLCSDTCQPEVSSFPLVNVAALTPPNLPTKLGNITGRNIISCASLRNVFHWLSSLFKWYKSVLLKRKRDTGTEKKNKQTKKQTEIPFKMMSVLFCLLRVHLLLSNLNTVYHVNDYMSDD